MLNEEMLRLIEAALARGHNVTISPSYNGRLVIREMTQRTVYDTKNTTK